MEQTKREKILEDIKNVIANLKECCTCDIHPESDLRIDLKCTTGDLLKIYGEVSWEYSIDIEEDLWLKNAQTVSSILEMIDQYNDRIFFVSYVVKSTTNGSLIFGNTVLATEDFPSQVFLTEMVLEKNPGCTQVVILGLNGISYTDMLKF
jgi:acyl carrier protein